jgi:hypothetical protein
LQDKTRIAKIVIPLAIGAWLLGALISQPGVPAAAVAVYVVALFVAIPTAVFYLMSEQGWSTLAKRYRSTARYSGGWQACPTGQMALVSVDDPAFIQKRLRLVGTLRVGVAADVLHLSMLFSKLPLLGRFFPEVEIPWSAVASARTYEAPGWVPPQVQPGTVLQASFDPGYTGTFVEMRIGDPPVFIQLPLDILGEATSRLGLSRGNSA